MPLNRYQIRNEYSLADPELYRGADKDDPEALLEGIAMAGLVGVLRQLGDLAEFAAEIFHDLHEQVMATASRGHSLMVRVQQLEAEFPTIEKAFLCQTNHSSFYYNAGTEWHPNLRMDQNLITQGDLPRFVMDSYEECRGPPRLFLLDKFDVAGAGACLKRYTDPSFFKVETSYSDVIRDKRPRKAKRKVSRWRNGETPETLPTSHAKLHQLFLEERLENGTLNSAGRVKLKRRLNGFPFDTKSGKSYMEKFLNPPSPNHDEVHEIPEDLSPLALPSNNTYQSTFDVVEIHVVSPEKKSKQRMRSPELSPAGEEITPELVVDELNEVWSADDSVEVAKPELGFQAYRISSASHAVSTEKDIPVDGSSKREDSIDDDQSDDVASEIENYVDALTTMDSEIDTDSELRSKSRGQASDADANDAQIQAHSADSVSTGNSTLSDDGNSSSKKDLSSFSSSDTHSTSAENIPLDSEVSSNVLTTAEILEAEPLPVQQSIDEERHVEGTASDGAFVESSEISSYHIQCYDLIGSSSPKDSVLVHKSTEAVVKDTASTGIEIDDTESFSRGVPSTPFVADVCEHNGEYLSPKMSGESLDDFLPEGAVEIDNTGFASDKPVPSLSKYDFPLQVTSEKQFAEEFDEGVNQDKKAVASADSLIVGHAKDENLLDTEIQPLDELLDGEKLSSTTNHSDVLLQNSDESPTISPPNVPLNVLGVVVPDCDVDVSEGVSNNLEADTENHINEMAQEYVLQGSHMGYKSGENVVGSQNSDLPLSKGQLSNPANEELEIQYSRIQVDERVSEVDSALSVGQRSKSLALEVDAPAPIRRELVESCNPKVDTEHEPLNEQTSYLKEECHDQPTSVGDSAIVDEAASDSDLMVSATTAGTSLSAEVHVRLEEVDHEHVIAAATVAGHDDDNPIISDGGSTDLEKLQEGSLSCFRDDHSALGIDTYLSNKAVESDVFDDVDEQPFTSPGLNNLHDTVIDDDLRSQICDDARYLISGTENGQNIDEARTIQSPEQKYDLDPHSLEEDIGLQPRHLGTDLHGKSADSSGLFTVLQQPHVSNNDAHLGAFDTYSESSLKNISIQSSAPEQLSQGSSKIDTFEHFLDLSTPISSSFSMLPDSSQIYVEEIPPLPPLPPVQWRMGKFQNSSPARENILESHNVAAFPPQFSSSVNQDALDLNPLSLQPALSDVESTPLSEQPICSSSPVVHHGGQKDTILPLEGFQVAGTLLQSSGMHDEILPNDVQGGGKVKSDLDSSHQGYVMDSANSIKLSGEGLLKPLDQMVPETILSDLELGQHSAHSDDNVATCDNTEISVKIGNEDTKPTLEENLPLLADEGGMLNGNRTIKQPRPRNPLIDAVVAHDKSKLRKVPERVKPQIKKDDERDSLLAQIRTKSFNLKPAAVTRPSIQGPKTNLQVAAILEKAKTIRQAFAGSDEDDDGDSWSDS